MSREPDRFMTWLEARGIAGCNCEVSDAWKCAAGRNARTVACACFCHSYLHQRLSIYDLPGAHARD